MDYVLGFSDVKGHDVGVPKDWSQPPKFRVLRTKGELEKLGFCAYATEPIDESRIQRKRIVLPQVQSSAVDHSEGKRHILCENTKYSCGMDWNSRRRYLSPVRQPQGPDKSSIKVFPEMSGYESWAISEESNTRDHPERRHHNPESNVLYSTKAKPDPTFEHSLGRKSRVDELEMRNGFEVRSPGDKPYIASEESTGFYNESTTPAIVWRLQGRQFLTKNSSGRKGLDIDNIGVLTKIDREMQQLDIQDVKGLEEWTQKKLPPPPKPVAEPQPSPAPVVPPTLLKKDANAGNPTPQTSAALPKLSQTKSGK